MCGSREESLAFNKACHTEAKRERVTTSYFQCLTSLIYLREKKETGDRSGKLSPEGVDYVIGDTEVSRN